MPTRFGLCGFLGFLVQVGGPVSYINSLTALRDRHCLPVRFVRTTKYLKAEWVGGRHEAEIRSTWINVAKEDN